MSTTRGLRNNNPGNIEYNKYTAKYNGCIGSDGRFCIFATMQDGLRAIGRLLLIYHHNYNISTVRQLVNRWAPSVENNVNAYIATLTKSSGYFADEPLDFTDENVLYSLIEGIGRHENGWVRFDEQVAPDQIYFAARKAISNN